MRILVPVIFFSASLGAASLMSAKITSPKVDDTSISNTSPQQEQEPRSHDHSVLLSIMAKNMRLGSSASPLAAGKLGVRLGKQIQVQTSGPVWHLAISPDSHKLASVGADGLRIHALPDWKSLLHKKSARRAAFASCRFSPDGTKLLLAPLTSKLMRVLETESGRVTTTIMVPNYVPLASSFVLNGNAILITESEDILMWAFKDGAETRTKLKGMFYHFSTAGQGGRLYATEDTERILEFSLSFPARSPKVFYREESPYGAVGCGLLASSQGDKLISWGPRRMILIRDAKRSAVVHELAKDQEFFAIGVSGDCNVIAALIQDHPEGMSPTTCLLKVWDLKDLGDWTYEVKDKGLCCLAIASDGRTLYAGDENGNVYVWEIVRRL